MGAKHGAAHAVAIGVLLGITSASAASSCQLKLLTVGLTTEVEALDPALVHCFDDIGNIDTRLQLATPADNPAPASNTVHVAANQELGVLTPEAHATCSISVGHRMVVPDVQSGSGRPCWVSPLDFDDQPHRCSTAHGGYELQCTPFNSTASDTFGGVSDGSEMPEAGQNGNMATRLQVLQSTGLYRQQVMEARYYYLAAGAMLVAALCAVVVNMLSPTITPPSQWLVPMSDVEAANPEAPERPLPEFIEALSPRKSAVLLSAKSRLRSLFGRPKPILILTPSSSNVNLCIGIPEGALDRTVSGMSMADYPYSPSATYSSASSTAGTLSRCNSTTAAEALALVQSPREQLAPVPPRRVQWGPSSSASPAHCSRPAGKGSLHDLASCQSGGEDSDRLMQGVGSTRRTQGGSSAGEAGSIELPQTCHAATATTTGQREGPVQGRESKKEGVRDSTGDSTAVDEQAVPGERHSTGESPAAKESHSPNGYAVPSNSCRMGHSITHLHSNSSSCSCSPRGSGRAPVAPRPWSPSKALYSGCPSAAASPRSGNSSAAATPRVASRFSRAARNTDYCSVAPEAGSAGASRPGTPNMGQATTGQGTASRTASSGGPLTGPAGPSEQLRRALSYTSRLLQRTASTADCGSQVVSARRSGINGSTHALLAEPLMGEDMSNAASGEDADERNSNAQRDSAASLTLKASEGFEQA